jgi:hypothetical protein
MVKTIAIICILICFACSSSSQAAGSAALFGKLAQEALKLVGSEALKSGVEYFKDLFNKDKYIAKRYGKPELKGGGLKDDVRTWMISPSGKLSESDIKEIARTLKSLDKNRDQTIQNQNQIFKTTQTGVVTQSGNITGSGNTMIATGGDYVAGDKFGGDYVAGDKIVRPSEVQDIACNSLSIAANCPLEVSAYSYRLPHPEGSSVDGIVWKEDIYSDVRVLLTNRNLARIYNINFLLKPETHVREAVQATNVQGVIITPDKNLGGLRVGEMSLEVISEKGVSQSIPLPTKSEFIAPGIKVQASELLGTGEMKIVMACIAINPSVDGKPPEPFLAPARPPRWIRISGTYETTEAGLQKRFHFNDEFPLAVGRLAR